MSAVVPAVMSCDVGGDPGAAAVVVAEAGSIVAEVLVR
jgi:hypothetical protein